MNLFTSRDLPDYIVKWNPRRADVEIEGWWTNLTVSKDKVIELYKGHALCEQYHSEIKTDMDLERLPSGKFATK